MKKLLLLSLLALSSLATTACSVSGEIQDLTERKTIVAQDNAAAITMGGNVQVKNGYTVSTSIGESAYVDGNTQTVNGYTVYSNLQGAVSYENKSETVVQ